ncbi:MAG: dihydroorotase [Planctomycetota bacterium]|jgi:dihydroorotase|nr:dihydroorotase [Planctomycetota bacterium]
MSSIRITDARIVTPDGIVEGDCLIRDDRIEAIGNVTADADEIIAAEGRVLLPGMIDDQVHFREPGITHKADIAHESRAAAAGGITSFMEMPNTVPPTLSMDAIEDKCAIAARTSAANYAFYLGASNDNLEAVKTADPRRIAGIKVFMGSSTGNMLVDQEATLTGIFKHAPCLVATHCEHTPTVVANENAARERFGDDVPVDQHPVIRNAEVCYASSSKAVALAKEHGTRLHVLHLTTAREMSLFEPGPSATKRITAEVCVHHLWFSDADYAAKGANIKCNPAVKSAADRAALRAALIEGRIDVIATDHAPHTREEKARPGMSAPAGLPYAQHALPALLDLVHQGVFSLELIADRYAANVARMYDIRERGSIVPGNFADLTLVDPSAAVTIRDDTILSKCAWSPFAGDTLHGRVDVTLVNGQVVWRDGQIVDGVRGRRLVFDR